QPSSLLYKAKSAATNFVKSLELSEDRIGVIEFSGSRTLMIGLSSSQQDLLNAIGQIHTDPNGGTAIGPAVALAHSYLPVPSPANDRARVIIFLTDGQDTAGGDPVAAAGRAKDDVIRVTTIGLASGVDEQVLTDMASVNDNRPNH